MPITYRAVPVALFELSCSFKTTYPSPGKDINVLGVGFWLVALPLMVAPIKVVPACWEKLPSQNSELVTFNLPTLKSPCSRFTLETLAVLFAWELEDCICPDAETLRLPVLPTDGTFVPVSLLWLDPPRQ